MMANDHDHDDEGVGDDDCVSASKIHNQKMSNFSLHLANMQTIIADVISTIHSFSPAACW